MDIKRKFQVFPYLHLLMVKTLKSNSSYYGTQDDEGNYFLKS